MSAPLLLQLRRAAAGTCSSAFLWVWPGRVQTYSPEDRIAGTLRGCLHGPHPDTFVVAVLEADCPHFTLPESEPYDVQVLAETLPQPGAHFPFPAVVRVKSDVAVVGPEYDLLVGVDLIGEPLDIPRHHPVAVA